MQENSSLILVKSIIQYIEDNIYNRIVLEDISNFTNVSMYHLHRIFKALTGKKLINYVNSRKLAHSINELLHTNLRIIDIANEYDFKFEQSYIRAFIREFGISPDEFRRRRCQIPIIDKIDTNPIKPIGSSGLLFKPEIHIKPSFFITGLRYYVNNQENDNTCQLTSIANDFFYNCRPTIKNKKNPNVYIGFIEHIPENRAYRYYTTACETLNIKNIGEGMYGCYVPTHKYVVFKYIGMHHADKTTIKDLLSMYFFAGEWIRNSNYAVADKFLFERIDYDISSHDYCEVEIYMPIKQKNSNADNYNWMLRPKKEPDTNQE